MPSESPYPETPSKRIILCCDGTWQKTFNHMPPSNIEHITVLLNSKATIKTPSGEEKTIPQVVYYHSGIGTSNDKYSSGISGKGIDLQIKNLYKYLVDNYVKGDEIYCFGFSRGSYAIRSLLGLINNCGILKKDGYTEMADGQRRYYNAKMIDKVYAIYRSRNQHHKPSERYAHFQDSQSYHDVPIQFLGAFDTVIFFGLANEYQFVVSAHHDPEKTWLAHNSGHF